MPINSSPEFFSGINPKRKLSTEQVKEMLVDFKDRKESVKKIAQKYGVTEANVYYHASRKIRPQEDAAPVTPPPAV